LIDMVTEDRFEQFVQLRGLLARWALRQDDIVAAAVVGSWARRSARMDSDLDVVVLTTHPGQYVADDRWIAAAVGQDASVVRTQEWGPLTARRVRLSSGLEVEFGFVAPSWAAQDPVDPGTARVVRDGFEALVDEDGMLARLITAVRRGTTRSITPL
jgi:predicted nucleotidyltransferase